VVFILTLVFAVIMMFILLMMVAIIPIIIIVVLLIIVPGWVRLLISVATIISVRRRSAIHAIRWSIVNTSV
jgi:hypothetical protein